MYSWLQLNMLRWLIKSMGSLWSNCLLVPLVFSPELAFSFFYNMHRLRIFQIFKFRFIFWIELNWIICLIKLPPSPVNSLNSSRMLNIFASFDGETPGLSTVPGTQEAQKHLFLKQLNEWPNELGNKPHLINVWKSWRHSFWA